MGPLPPPLAPLFRRSPSESTLLSSLLNQNAFPITPVIRDALSLETPIADRERLDLTLIELAYRPSAFHQKN
jgi:hypothetical protein